MTLERLPDPAAARAWCAARRREGATLGFVPTMGALHEGHLALVRRAGTENDAVCVSVFVNPLQFDDPADLAAYPRDPDGDARLLRGAGCTMMFEGTLAGFFPEAESPGAIPAVDPGAAARGLEGDSRPGHFAGVATIVARLFEVVRPDRAYFGAKDFQQTRVVEHVAAGLGFPEIVVCPTIREPDGLALSSRNRRLSPEARERALAISRALRAAARAWEEGERRAGVLEAGLVEALRAPGIELEYAVVRDPAALDRVPEAALEQGRALVAARVGGVRLIDNVALDGSPA